MQRNAVHEWRGRFSRPISIMRPRQVFLAHVAVLIQLTFAVVGAALGAEYYVSPAGVDSNNGGQATPFREIRRALNAISPGDTVIVADGNYKGFDAVSLGSANTVTKIIAPGRKAIITKTTDRGINNPNNMVVWLCTNVVFEGLQTFGSANAGMRIIESNHITVRYGVFGNHYRWGIVTSHSNDIVLEYNDCYGSIEQHGIYVANSGDRPIVRGNRLHDNVGSGLRSNGDVIQGGDGIITGALFEDNIIYNNGSLGGAGMNLDGLQDGIIRNNLLYNNLATGIALFKGGGAEGPKAMQVLNNTIITPAAARYNLRITDAIGPITVRNNLLFNATTAKGPFSWNTSSDAAWTDSDYNAFGGGRFISTDGETTRISLDTWFASGHEPHSLPLITLESSVVNPANADFRLKTGSPLIDAGTTLANVLTDILGTSRTLGNAPDIGVYEHGLYAAWKTTQGIPLATPDTFDSDADGIPLLMEYAMDSDPKAAFPMRQPTVTRQAGSLQLSYPLQRADLVYAAETSSDLKNWTSNGVENSSPGTASSASVLIVPNRSRQYLRLKVTLP